jgi:hypothetical protein
MSDASDSQNRSADASVDLDAGSSPEESYHEGERSSPSLPKAATRTRKRKDSDGEHEDFQVDVTSKKKALVQKEYANTQREIGVTRKVSASTAAKGGITLENPGGSQQGQSKYMPKAAGKKRERKQTVQVVFKPTSMRI